MRNRTNRRRRELLAGGESRTLPPAAWALFKALYAGRGHPLSGDFLRKAICVSALGDHVYQLRRALGLDFVEHPRQRHPMGGDLL